MNYSLKESSLSEVFRIISINIDKINYLGSTIINPHYNNLEIKQFLSEFEYDLKLIYDILREYKYSFNNEYNKKNKSSGMKNIDYLKISDRIKKHLNLNDLEDCIRNNYKDNKNKDNKKYNLTINILSDKYFDSKRKMNKKFNKSKSCKSYKKNYPKNLIKNLKMNLKGNYCYTEKRNENNFNEDKTQTYFTESSNEKRYKESNNKFRTNIDKNKASFKQLNTLYNYYDELLKKNNNKIENDNCEYDTISTNRLDLDNNNIKYNSPFYKTYNIISSEENNNQSKNIIEKEIGDNYNNYRKNNYSYIRDYERNNNYMKEKVNKKNNENSKEIIKKILSQILKDNNIINELKKRFGDDVGIKLLEGGFDINEINSIYDFIYEYENNINKNEKEKNLFRGSKHYYRNYKHDSNNNNILLLRDSKRDKNKYYNFYDYEYDNCNHIPFSDEY